MYQNQYKFKYLEEQDPDWFPEVVRNWRSQLDFLKDEQAFLAALLKENTLALLTEKDMAHTREVASQLIALQEELPEHRAALEYYKNDIEKWMQKTPSATTKKTICDTHVLMELSIERYLKRYQKLKSDIFYIMKVCFQHLRKEQLLKP